MVLTLGFQADLVACAYPFFKGTGERLMSEAIYFLRARTRFSVRRQIIILRSVRRISNFLDALQGDHDQCSDSEFCRTRMDLFQPSDSPEVQLNLKRYGVVFSQNSTFFVILID